MATNDITISASNSAQHEQQQHDPVRFAIASIVFAGGGIPTIRIENENTGEISAMTPRAIAMDQHIVNHMTPEDALLVGLWYGKEQAKETHDLNVQELLKSEANAALEKEEVAA